MQQPIKDIPRIIGDTTILAGATPPVEEIRGRVMDNSGQPVPFASVTFDRRRGVEADADGKKAYPVVLAGSMEIQGMVVVAVSYRKRWFRPARWFRFKAKTAKGLEREDRKRSGPPVQK